MGPHRPAGTEPGERQLNGPQTTGRQYLVLASDDVRDSGAFSGFEHAAVGGPARQTIHASSHLWLSVVGGAPALT
jgi:hypothetical protein